MKRIHSLALGRFTLIHPLIGVMSFCFMCGNVLFWAGLMHVFAVSRLWQKKRSLARTEKLYDVCFSGWISTNEWWFQRVLGVYWQLDESMQKDFEHWHLMVANHRSWADVYIILAQLNGRRPLPRVFIKQILFWLPLVGSAAWLMGFPFMKRYSKAKLQKSPHLKGKDLATTRQSCERFMQRPNSVLSFVEGTRFSPKKHRQQGVPYHCLLKPKAGGVSLVLQAMPGKFSRLTDINVLYGQKNISFWDLLCGRLTEAQLIVRDVALPESMLQPTYQAATSDREDFFAWFNLYWHDKDSRMVQQLKAMKATNTPLKDVLREGNTSQK
ncbi:acetyltransferase [Marinomonas pollencensis]|uniref:Acyltransferase-like protein n=1 Tax=Marinomonas pollencensis TaxID=491954 RepID=A0A3E0DPF5_9GAMM|nr:acetyltransferase [Marinomonas pollencensis]REG84836.1 acyltransferase-like protein [Marinomonas pollencensis]